MQRANAGELDTIATAATAAATAATTEPAVAVLDLVDKTDDSDPTMELHTKLEAKHNDVLVATDGLVDSDEEEDSHRKRTKIARVSSSPSPKRKTRGRDTDGNNDDGDDDLMFAKTTKRWRKNESKARKGASRGVSKNDEDADDDEDAFVDLTKDDNGGKADDTLEEWAALLKGDSRKKRSRPDKKNKKPAPPPPKPIEPTRQCNLKLVLFAHHKEVLDALEIRLTELNLSYIRIDGSTPVTSRHNLITRFQEDDTTTVALLGMTACGTGVNFTRASIAIFAELYWTPGVLLQAEDRIHR